MLSATNPLSLQTTKEGLGERPAWVRVAEKCERSQPACAIRRPPMSPIEICKRVESNGWGLPRRRTRDATGSRFGKKTAIQLLSRPQIFTTLGSPNGLD